MKERWTPVVLIAIAGAFLCACGSREEAPAATETAVAPAASLAPEAAPPPLAAEPAPEPAPPSPPPEATAPPPPQRPAAKAPPATAVPSPPAKATALPPPPASPTAVPSPTTPPAPTAAPAPAPAPSGGVVDPGGEVGVPAGKPGLTRVGAEKCRLCHKVQHASWATTAHARRTPPLDCEGCHGPGSEYKALAVMKDPVKAKAAGLVEPDAPFCGRCHKGKWDPAMLGKVHAHKSAS